MKRLYIVLFALLVVVVEVKAQFVADLDGFPLVTTGWNIGGFGTVVDSSVRLTSPSTTQNGYVYYNTPVNLTGCGQFTVDFDYRIQQHLSTTIADGIAFWYISNPPSGFVTGGGIGLPSFANGLIMIMDTYDNTAPYNVPLATLLGYDGSIAGYTEGSTAGLLAPVVGTLPYITDGTWRHCKITYNVGNVNVYFNYSPIPTLTGFYPLTISGYFGFSSSTGAAYSTQSVKSVHITALVSLPVPVVTSPVTYCQNDVAVPVSATGVTGATVRWFSTDTGMTVSLPGAPTPNTSVPGTTTYYVRQFAGTCISPSDSVVVVVNPQPLPPAITGVTAYCQNAPFVPFTTTGSGVMWYAAATGGTGSATAPVVPTAVPGTYKYYASQTLLGCESLRDSITVVVHATPPTPVLTAGLNTYCQFAPFVPFAVTGTNVRWYTVPTGGMGTTIAPVINTSVPGSYNYYVTQTDTNGCESNRLHVPVTVYAEPPAPTATDVTHCQYTLAPPLIAGGVGMVWYGPGIGAGGTATTPVPSTALTGKDTFYVTQTIDGCVSDSAMLVVTVDSTPETPVAMSNSPVCENDTLFLWASSGTGGVSWTWAGPNSFADVVPNTSILNVTPAAAGFYTVTATLGSCSSVALVSVSITLLPPVTITSNSPVCSGANDTLFLQAVSSVGATYTWIGPYVFYSNAQNPTRTPVSEEYEGTYHVTVTMDGCVNTASHTVVVNPTPAAPWIKWLTYCQYYDAPYLQAYGSNVLWYTSSAGGGGGSAAPPKPQTDVVGINFYYVNQTVAGCPSVIDSIRVQVHPKPTVIVSEDTVVCPRDTAVLTAVNADAIAYYSWYPDMYLSDTNGATVIVRPETDMNYTVVTRNMYNCTDTATVAVAVRADAVIHLEDSVMLYPGEQYQISPSTNCTQFSWTPSGGLSGKYLSNPVATPEVSTKYVVTGKTEWGCVTKDSINVVVNTEAVLTLPNAFAPGNGVNGRFKVMRRGLATLQYFRIYDRWGVVVYETKNIEEGWDGTYKGVPQPVGVYVYDVSAVTVSGVVYKKTGNVTLLR